MTLVTGENSEQAFAIRSGLEQMRLRVTVYHGVWKQHLLDFFAVRFPAMTRSCSAARAAGARRKGKSGRRKRWASRTACVENLDGKFQWGLTEFVLTPANIPERVHLPGKTLITSACGSGREAFARAFLGAGCRTYIATSGETDQNAVNLFILAFFYHLLANERDPQADCTERQAFERAASLDTWCRWGTHRFRYYTHDPAAG